ncbi:hypothetical protein SOVF_110240 [Spinacia oleracea]|nr:hypothetical protein SOVF_110240 [Spinacia oleracea]
MSFKWSLYAKVSSGRRRAKVFSGRVKIGPRVQRQKGA